MIVVGMRSYERLEHKEAAQKPDGGKHSRRAKSEDELDPARIRTQELECYGDIMQRQRQGQLDRVSTSSRQPRKACDCPRRTTFGSKQMGGCALANEWTARGCQLRADRASERLKGFLQIRGRFTRAKSPGQTTIGSTARGKHTACARGFSGGITRETSPNREAGRTRKVREVSRPGDQEQGERR